MTEPFAQEVSIRQTSRLLVGLGGILAVLGLIVAADRQVAVAAIYAAAAVVCLNFSTVHVIANRQGLTVRVGHLGRPRLKVAAADVVEVENRSVSALRAGGFGYRGSWSLGGRVVVSLGGRQGVYVRTAKGKRLHVTLGSADEVVRVLRAGMGAPATPT
jgi:hypothetical protein